MSKNRAAIVLAAGKGKRMESDLPKVLHTINGRPMISVVLERLETLNISKTVLVIGYQGELVQKQLADSRVDFVWQREQLGTGHAVMMARRELADFEGTTLVALGDMPFVSTDSFKNLFDTHESLGAAATCLTAILDDPTGYGRIVRVPDSDLLQEIVEHRDATDEILAIKEINTGAFCFDNRLLYQSLDKITNQNSQQEYYLTDTIKILHGSGQKVAVVTTEDPDEGLGVNSTEQLDLLARKFAEKT
ncbi:MAG: NTP transferase domain-containing protein [candidate division Zixibacteria bacterium]|nr:NTP transferase domain-containing protein [candidate division Zixibacteria bacterium]MDH3935973.1 NTP transferase domain-containing protein [candidate division Zixibacteria bacterium]MDH4032709.1 NTP transferase domain-containing protein [candidate division Zixibacteria bacterium]